jgi:hypothetical protein
VRERYFRYLSGNADHFTSNEHRLLKEHNLYTKEAGDHHRKVARIVAENGEEWEIKIAVRPTPCLCHTHTTLLLRVVRAWAQRGNENALIQCNPCALAFGGSLPFSHWTVGFDRQGYSKSLRE